MRKCMRCQSDMMEDYGLKVESIFAGVAPVKLSEGQGLLSEKKNNIKAAVCPNCGEVSLYIENAKKTGKL